MYRTIRVAFVVLILAMPLSQAAASTSGGRADQARSSSDDLAPGIQRGATRCVAVEDVYTYEVGDRDMPLALKSLESLRNSQPADQILLHRGNGKGKLHAAEVVALRITVTDTTCSERGKGQQTNDALLAGKGSVIMAAPGECDTAGCVHPNPPSDWDWMGAGSTVRTEACSVDMAGTIRVEITVYKKRSDGKWVMITYHSELKVECGALQ